MKHSITLSMFTCKPRLIGEGGFSLRMAYQLNYVFLIQIWLFTYKPRGVLPGTCGKNVTPKLTCPILSIHVLVYRL